MPVENVLSWVCFLMVFYLIILAIFGFLWNRAEYKSKEDEIFGTVAMFFFGALLSTMFVLGLFIANGYTIPL